MAEYLYVIRRSDGARKLGRSRDPERRLKQIACDFRASACLTLEYHTPCPEDWTAKAETHAHHLNHERRLDGEWFEIDEATARASVDAAVSIAEQGGPFPVLIQRVAVCFMVDRDLREAIKRWRHANKFETEGEAMRTLLRRALEAG